MTTAPPPSGVATVNGEAFPLDATPGTPLDVVRLVSTLLPGFVVDGAPRGVAVAINDAVLPRGAWSTTVVAAGDRVEVVSATQGG